MLIEVLRAVRREIVQITKPAPTGSVNESASVFGVDDGELYRMFIESGGGDIHKWHHYFAIYERYFARFREKPISLLEIGVSKGGSLRLWRKYFGPAAQITGIDVDPECSKYSSEGFNVSIGDQSDPEFLATVAEKYGPFDIVIDDGGHSARQQFVSYEILFPNVKDGGIYLVEDLHTSFWPAFMDYQAGVSFIDIASRMVEKLTWWHRDPGAMTRFGRPLAERTGNVDVPEITRSIFSIAFYDSVIVFEKKKIPEPWHEIR